MKKILLTILLFIFSCMGPEPDSADCAGIIGGSTTLEECALGSWIADAENSTCNNVETGDACPINDSVLSAGFMFNENNIAYDYTFKTEGHILSAEHTWSIIDNQLSVTYNSDSILESIEIIDNKLFMTIHILSPDGAEYSAIVVHNKCENELDCNGTCSGSDFSCKDCIGRLGGNAIDGDNDGICDTLQGTVTDIDGNIYETIQIGNQLWIAYNLKVTHLNNGDAIPTEYSNLEWTELETGAYAIYDDDPTNTDIYGYLYNWYAITDERNICPADWHVPSDEEWKILINYLDENANMKLKESGCENWDCLDNNIGTNESGFTALPGGYRHGGSETIKLGNYFDLSKIAYFWSTSTLEDQTSYLSLSRSASNVDSYFLDSSLNGIHNKNNGFSVRCIKD